MTERPGLDERLRAALGAGRSVGAPRVDAQSAKSDVLAALQRRRARTLQVVGLAVLVALGLALGLPRVLGGTTPPERSASAGADANAPAAHAKSSPASTDAAVGSLSARCSVGGRAAAACGTLDTTAAEEGAAASATEAGRSPAFESATPTGTAAGTPLVVRSGTSVVVELPGDRGRWRWGTPAIAGKPAYHGLGPPVTVRALGSRAGAQRFLVSAEVSVTLDLEAHAEPVSSRHASSTAAPAAAAAPVATWVVRMEVEGT